MSASLFLLPICGLGATLRRFRHGEPPSPFAAPPDHCDVVIIRCDWCHNPSPSLAQGFLLGTSLLCSELDNVYTRVRRGPGGPLYSISYITLLYRGLFLTFTLLPCSKSSILITCITTLPCLRATLTSGRRAVHQRHASVRLLPFSSVLLGVQTQPLGSN